MKSLSELPDNIICHIISLASLTNKEAIQLSLLSREVFSALQKRPALRFDGGHKEELEYVHSTLARYHADGIPLHIFAFKMGYEFKNLQTQCITLAAKKRLRGLDVQGFGNFPKPFFKVESLVDLSLKGSSFHLPVSILWPNLKRLCLVDVTMELKVFQNIIMGSPWIQNLEIIRCFDWTVKKFKVSNLRNLKQLKVELTGTQTFEVDAPGLESITCSHPPRKTEIIENIGQLYNFSAGLYQNLKTLSLDCVGFSDNFFRNFDHQFRRLENLSISNNTVLKLLVLSSSSLKNIRLENIPKLDKAFLGVPNVVLFEYSADTRSHSIPELSFSGNPCGWISRIKLSYTYRSINPCWILKLREFLTALNMSEISITVKFHGLHKNSHQNIVGVRPKVHEFCIEIWEFSLSFARAIEDTIFWICEPQTVTYPPYYRDKFESLVYKKRISESVHEKKIRSSTWFRFKFFSCLFPFS